MTNKKVSLTPFYRDSTTTKNNFHGGMTFNMVSQTMLLGKTLKQILHLKTGFWIIRGGAITAEFSHWWYRVSIKRQIF